MSYHSPSNDPSIGRTGGEILLILHYIFFLLPLPSPILYPPLSTNMREGGRKGRALNGEAICHSFCLIFPPAAATAIRTNPAGLMPTSKLHAHSPLFLFPLPFTRPHLRKMTKKKSPRFTKKSSHHCNKPVVQIFEIVSQISKNASPVGRRAL